MSTRWFSKPLGDGLRAYRPTDQYGHAFKPLFVPARLPTDRAVFIRRHELQGRPQCGVTAYFSPAAALAHVLNALTCEKPIWDPLELLAGDPGRWPVVFPGFE